MSGVEGDHSSDFVLVIMLRLRNPTCGLGGLGVGDEHPPVYTCDTPGVYL